jgi:hypothetical protein
MACGRSRALARPNVLHRELQRRLLIVPRKAICTFQAANDSMENKEKPRAVFQAASRRMTGAETMGSGGRLWVDAGEHSGNGEGSQTRPLGTADESCPRGVVAVSGDGWATMSLFGLDAQHGVSVTGSARLK